MNLTPEQVAGYNQRAEAGEEPKLEWEKRGCAWKFTERGPLSEFGIQVRGVVFSLYWVEYRDGGCWEPGEGDFEYETIPGFTTWKAAALAAEDIIRKAVKGLFESRKMLSECKRGDVVELGGSLVSLSSDPERFGDRFLAEYNRFTGSGHVRKDVKVLVVRESK